MRIAVVQHGLRQSAAEDAEGLYQAALAAQDAGAALVVFPEVCSLIGEDNPDRAMLFLQLGPLDGARLIPQLGPAHRGYWGLASAPDGVEELGTMALLVGDSCCDPAALEALAAEKPDLAVLIPRSESELQAEAIFELALGLSDSLAGLVVVAETDGAELGEPGHGGSTIIQLGKVLAEAETGDDLLVVEVDVPLSAPEPREPLPQVPTILQQRFATHNGEKLEVPYPADLQD